MIWTQELCVDRYASLVFCNELLFNSISLFYLRFFLWKASTAVDQAEDLAFCRGLFDEIISIAAPADTNAIDPGHVIGALEFMKDNGDIHPEVVVDLQNLLSKVSVGHALRCV